MLERLNDAFVTLDARGARRRHATVTYGVRAVSILFGLRRPRLAGPFKGARMRKVRGARGLWLEIVVMGGGALGVVGALGLVGAGAMAQTVEARTVEEQKPAQSALPPASTRSSGACIETEVNGYRALSYDCLNQKMAPDTTANRPSSGLASEAITQRPPNQMGLPTPATIGNRMGNTFGTSAYPQRPQP